MFTGLIQAIGTVRKVVMKSGEAVVEIAVPDPIADLKKGDSISVSGACLTVVELTRDGFTADVSAETLARTTLKELKPGARVNLESSLRLSSFLGGHLVLGHVDGVGRVIERTNKAGSIVFGIEIEEGLVKYLVEKGSVAVDGISLTVNRVEKNRFYVNIIPATISATTLEGKRRGDSVNIETDIIGKYVERFLQRGKGIDRDFLAEHGFIK